MPRNNEILRTPNDPEATYSYMIRAWGDPEAGHGSAGWYRIIKDAGPTLTWEWFMVDESRPYAALFPAELRDRVRKALESDAGNTVWVERQRDSATEDQERAERISRISDEIRTGKRKRLSFPELDHDR